MNADAICNYSILSLVILDIIFALFSLSSGIGMIYRGKSNISYEKTTGTLVNGSIKTTEMKRRSGTNIGYMLTTYYTYNAKGNNYTFENESTFIYKSKIDAENQLKKLVDKKESIDVYYDKENPGNATTEIPSSYSYYSGISLIVCVVFIIISTITKIIFKDKLCKLV